jgi:hypothetical protein
MQLQVLVVYGRMNARLVPLFVQRTSDCLLKCHSFLTTIGDLSVERESSTAEVDGYRAMNLTAGYLPIM